MGMQNFIGQLAYVVSPWFLWIMTERGLVRPTCGRARRASPSGSRLFVAAVGVLPALSSCASASRQVAIAGAVPKVDVAGSALLRNLREFFSAFALTLKSAPFLKLCVATFLVFNGFMLISAFQTTSSSTTCSAATQAMGAEYAGYSGTVGAVSTFVVIVFVTWLATQIGKRKAFFVSTGVSMVGYALKWFCYDPAVPWLLLVPAPLMAFGLGGLFTLMPSMIATSSTWTSWRPTNAARACTAPSSGGW